MKRIIIILVTAFILLQAPAASAQVVKAESKVVVVKEEQLIKLAGEEKFANLMGVLKKLVQDSLTTQDPKQEKATVIPVTKINILNFKYLPEGKIKIYYYLD